jgi:hypothetical protein
MDMDENLLASKCSAMGAQALAFFERLGMILLVWIFFFVVAAVLGTFARLLWESFVWGWGLPLVVIRG